MFRTYPNAIFDSHGNPCCPGCSSRAIPNDAAPNYGVKVRCESCTKKFQLPKRREFLRLQHAAKVAELAQTPDRRNRDVWIALTAEGRLSGARNIDLQSCMSEVGLSDIEITDYIESSNSIVRAGARAAGRVMFFIGIATVLGCAAVIAILSYLELGIVVVPIGLAALGLIFTVVGLVKWVTGWNIH